MRISLLVLVVPLVQYCYAQESYNAKLDAKLEEIKKLEEYDNGVVIFDDDSGNGSDFPIWDPTLDYYQDDIVAVPGGFLYRCVRDCKGKHPTESPDDWKLMRGRHPYLFLRDTAKTEDLRTLLTSNHPFIRAYAVGALAYRKYVGLFKVVVDNLGDTTQILQYTSDFGYTVYPADLMLWYTVEEFSREQKDILKTLILTQHTHLNTLDEILLFHKPVPADYPYIRQIAERDTLSEFAIVALSAYKNPGDVELIRRGLKNDQYYAGYKIIFIAAENYPHEAFKKDLIARKTEINMDYDMHGLKYYFNALAAFHDKKCLAILEEFVNQPVDKDKRNKTATSRSTNLRLIQQALRKHYVKMFDGLIKKIDLLALQTNSEELYFHQLEDSPWNY